MENNYQLDPNKWIENYADALYGFCIVRVNNQSIAEDIVQETFLSAWKARETYNAVATEKNWLYAICKNKIIDHYRKKGATITTETEDSDNYFDNEEHWTKEKQPNEWGLNGQTQLEKKEFYQVLANCKQKLKELQQQVFVLKYLEDFDSDQICNLLGISSSNYWVLIHRAKLQLRNCLEKNWIKI
ncbi:MAG: hypothetical protein RLY89_2693 [Bacteroidota bacterium]|jgi:RNA polymerase sigma-70 factor (TIGR02943 family)